MLVDFELVVFALTEVLQDEISLSRVMGILLEGTVPENRQPRVRAIIAQSSAIAIAGHDQANPDILGLEDITDHHDDIMFVENRDVLGLDIHPAPIVDDENDDVGRPDDMVAVVEPARKKAKKERSKKQRVESEVSSFD